MSGAPENDRDHSRAAGLLVTLAGLRRFIPASSALQVLPRPVVSRVPGSELCITLCAGRVIAVIELGTDASELIVCELDGEIVALSGLSVVRAGFFEADGPGVRVDGEQIPPLDLGAELERTERSLLAGAGAR
jgi:hypothetical protein